MQILTDSGGPAPQAPPSATPSPTVTTTMVPTTAPPTSQLPVTGPSSDVAVGALAIGLPVLLLGAVLLVLARRWRVRTGG